MTRRTTTDHSELIARLRLPCYERGLDEGWIDSERKEAADALEAATALSARSGGWRVALQYIAEYTAQTGGSPRLEHIHSTALEALTPPETTP